MINHIPWILFFANRGRVDGATSGRKKGVITTILDEKKLINECLSRSWTQMVLRTKSGVSFTTISKAYNGKPISDKSAKKIADALVINLDLLIKKG